ncbi:metal-dependent hydrolases of the beta-lactamase superfamily I, PhnP protein [Klebsiella grimontii]|nr:metal-dependent hydrolases of the beta-lactamase superfamily I, PhnP protein [Klebsiella grimontii]
MSLTIRLTGTGGAQLVPVFGCDCRACRRAAPTTRIAVAPVARR